MNLVFCQSPTNKDRQIREFDVVVIGAGPIPHTAPSILLELGFMINPEEFEWITNAQEQQKLVKAIAQGIKEWFATVE